MDVEIDVDSDYVVDTGNVVAFTNGLDLEPEPGCGRYLLNQSRLSCLMPANLSPEYKVAEAASRWIRAPSPAPWAAGARRRLIPEATAFSVF